MIGTRRAPASNGSQNWAYGADAVFQFYENIQFIEYIAKTSTAGRTGNDLSYRTRFIWNADRWGIDTERMFAGEDFNPEVGYVRRPEGFHRNHGSFRFSPRPRNLRGVRKLYFQGNVELFTNAADTHVESREQRAFVRADFTSGDRTQIEFTKTYEAIRAPFTLAKGVVVPTDVAGHAREEIRELFGEEAGK